MKHAFTLLAVMLHVAIAFRPAGGAQSDSPGYMTADETERYLTEKYQLDSPSRRYDKNAPVFRKTWTEDEKAAQRKAYLEAKAGHDRAVAEKAAQFTFPPGVYRYPGTGVTKFKGWGLVPAWYDRAPAWYGTGNCGTPSPDANANLKWPALREAQQQVADTLPNCCLAVGIEIGAVTIHPPNKQDAGKRLALVALEKVHGKTLESGGPRDESMKIEGSTIPVKFTHAQGLVAKDGSPKNFAIAGEDKNFLWAAAKLDPSTNMILVGSPKVPQPVAVRYAWAGNPDGCNLYNAAGLPMAPFRTEDLPVEVEPVKPLVVPAPERHSGQ